MPKMPQDEKIIMLTINKLQNIKPKKVICSPRIVSKCLFMSFFCCIFAASKL